MSHLFEGDDVCDVKISVNKNYASRYDNWRRREELEKLKSRYGEIGSGSSDTSEDDEEAEELTPEIEKDFFKTLSCLKKKDPKIYNEDVHFFSDKKQEDILLKKKKKNESKEKPMYLRDYERKLILEKEGKLSDEEEDEVPEEPPQSPTYIEEQQAIKESFQKALHDSEDDADPSDLGSLFKKRKKTNKEKEKEEEEYRQWLKGEKNEIEDKSTESDMKYLHDYWNDPNLESNEAFLRDYILGKRYLEKDDDDYIPTYDEIVHDSDEGLSEDEETLQHQAEFEHTYNFRFEEPDKEFIKRYPRTIESSLRRKDDTRKKRREELQERKIKEKERKKDEIKQLKALKRKEIMEKLEKLKEITGNPSIGFQDEDLEDDFDPAQYDKRMSQLFDDDFYQGEEDEKPELPDDAYDDLESENWDAWAGNETKDKHHTQSSNWEDEELHCEDPGFNMDCDYDPHAQHQKEMIEATRGKKRRLRKSKFAEALSKKKPVFNPNDRTFAEYFDEYYRLDFEDIIGDLPCRFKYRKVVPNNFGLSVEEVLSARDKELNRWCSLKKTYQYRPDNDEKYDVQAFWKKGQNENLKRKILPSLFSEDVEESVQEEKEQKKKKKKPRKRKKNRDEELETGSEVNQSMNADSSGHGRSESDDKSEDHVENNVLELDMCQVKKKRKRKRVESSGEASPEELNADGGEKEDVLSNTKVTKSKKKKKASGTIDVDGVSGQKFERNSNLLRSGKRKEEKKSKEKMDFTDERLKAYGINPKKFKNKLKYKSTNQL